MVRTYGRCPKKDRQYQIMRRPNKTKRRSTERETDTTGSRSNASHAIRRGRLLKAKLQLWVLSNPLTSNCTHLTTFITPFGCFCFKRLSFGSDLSKWSLSKNDVCDIGKARGSSMFNRQRTSVRQGPAGTRHLHTSRAKAHVRCQNHAQRQIFILAT